MDSNVITKIQSGNKKGFNIFFFLPIKHLQQVSAIVNKNLKTHHRLFSI